MADSSWSKFWRALAREFHFSKLCLFYLDRKAFTYTPFLPYDWRYQSVYVMYRWFLAIYFFGWAVEILSSISDPVVFAYLTSWAFLLFNLYLIIAAISTTSSYLSIHLLCSQDTQDSLRGEEEGLSDEEYLSDEGEEYSDKASPGEEEEGHADEWERGNRFSEVSLSEEGEGRADEPELSKEGGDNFSEVFLSEEGTDEPDLSRERGNHFSEVSLGEVVEGRANEPELSWERGNCFSEVSLGEEGEGRADEPELSKEGEDHHSEGPLSGEGAGHADAMEPPSEAEEGRADDDTPSGCCGRANNALSWYQMLHWLFFIIGNEPAVIVSLLYWTLGYQGGHVSAISAHTHLINGLAAIFDLLVSGTPIHLLHFVYLVFGPGLVYIFFTQIYFVVSGNVLYKGVLDYWASPGVAVAVVFCSVFLLLPFFHALGPYLLHLARDWVLRCCHQWWKKRRDGNLQDSHGIENSRMELVSV